jgi:hypothetical protein
MRRGLLMADASLPAMQTQVSRETHGPTSVVQLRRFPYPYRTLLAICSDLDETPDWHTYWETMRFLNTTEDTAVGPGVGLEVGNSIYFDMPPEQFAYWNTDDTGRAMIETMIKSGHIDCLHSYGDLAGTRKHAARALDELGRHDCKLQVWVDHGTAATNFDPGIMRGHGDEPGHEAYHADLTIDYGIQYIWRGRVTSITGQDIPAWLHGILQWRHPGASGRTLLKEAAKQTLARLGNAKYAMHGWNKVLRPTQLRDRQPVWEFMRCNPHWGGVSSCDQGWRIGNVLTGAMLHRLIERGGTSILYTHLGKVDDPRALFNPRAVQAFRLLAEASREGNVLVTTTRRLLGYCRAIREILFEEVQDEKGLRILVRTRANTRSPRGLSRADLNGLTFYVPEPGATSMVVDGREVATLRCNAPDHTGRPSVSLDWPLLEFPRL